MRILVFDFESGGPSLEFSPLTGCFKVFAGEDFSSMKEIDRLDLVIKHDIYKIHPDGMKVNGLDLSYINKVGVSTSKAGELLFQLIRKHGEDRRLIPLGHGVKGDLSIIFEYILKENNWDRFVSSVYMDTLAEAQSLKARGLLPLTQSLKLGDLSLFLGLPAVNFHTADGDVDATWRLFCKLGEIR